MSIYADIVDLEKQVQQVLENAYDHPAINNLREAYTEAILRGLPADLDSASDVDLNRVIEQSLQDAAVDFDDELADAIENDVRGMLDEAAAFYQGATGQAMPDLLDAAQSMKEFNALKQSFKDNMGTMRQGLFDETLSAMEDAFKQGTFNAADLRETIYEAADGPLHYARTNTRMIVGGYNRMGREMARREAGLKHGFYYGNVRTNTRYFCRSCVGKTFTMEQIEALSNGQNLDVRIYCGGWNCIHSWVWVEPEWDEELSSAQVESDLTEQHADEESLDVVVPE